MSLVLDFLAEQSTQEWAQRNANFSRFTMGDINGVLSPLTINIAPLYGFEKGYLNVTAEY